MGGVLTIGSGIAKTNKPYPWDPGTTASTFPWLCLSPFHLGILAFRHLPWILNSLLKSFILSLGSESSSTLPSLGVFTEIQLKKNVKFTVIHSEDFYKKWASYPGLQEGQDKPPPKRGRRAPNPTPGVCSGDEATACREMIQSRHLLEFSSVLLRSFRFREVMPLSLLSATVNCCVCCR